jgi:hypothetical protein
LFEAEPVATTQAAASFALTAAGRNRGAMFDGFSLETIALPEATLRVRRGGQGSPVLLLHGHPRTHVT